MCPVCAAPAPRVGPGLLFQGLRWYFCGMRCRLDFKRDPERWAASGAEAGLPLVATPILGVGPPRVSRPSPFVVRAGTVAKHADGAPPARGGDPSPEPSPSQAAARSRTDEPGPGRDGSQPE
jgi:hypothetical protein